MRRWKLELSLVRYSWNFFIRCLCGNISYPDFSTAGSIWMAEAPEKVKFIGSLTLHDRVNTRNQGNHVQEVGKCHPLLSESMLLFSGETLQESFLVQHICYVLGQFDREDRKIFGNYTGVGLDKPVHASFWY